MPAGYITSSLPVALPVVSVVDSNDQGGVTLNISGNYTSVEADIVAYIKTKVATVSGVGTVSAVKTSDSSTSV